MSKTKYYKDANGLLYTEREIRQYGIKGHLKKVYRSVDEITRIEDFGRCDRNFLDGGSVNEISTKQIRKVNISKQMVALGLL